MFWWILTRHHNSVDRPITVVWKLHPQSYLWSECDSTDLMKANMLRSKNCLTASLLMKSTTCPADILCGYPWLIWKKWRKRKNSHKNALYLAWFGRWRPMLCLWIYRLPCQYSFNWIPLPGKLGYVGKPKIHEALFTKSRSVYEKNEEPTYYSKDFTY